MSEEAPKNIDNRTKPESLLKEKKLLLENMKYDLENGRYPQGVPSEYHQEMEKLESEIEQIEFNLEEK